jgi:TolB-like protein
MRILKGIFYGAALVFLAFFQAPEGLSEDLRAGIDQLAQKVNEAVPEGRELKIAIIDFPDLQGTTCDLGRYIANRLTTQLSQNQKISVIERQQVGKTLTDLKFSTSDLGDPKNVKQLGKTIGADTLVMGSISDMDKQIDVDARMIDIESNKTLKGATATVNKDSAVEKMMANGCQKETPKETPKAATKETPKETKLPTKPGEIKLNPGQPKSSTPLSSYTYQTSLFYFQLEKIERNFGQVRVDIIVKNIGSQALLGNFEASGTYLTDNLGSKYTTSNGINARNSTVPAIISQLSKGRTFAPGDAQRLSLTFSGGGGGRTGGGGGGRTGGGRTGGGGMGSMGGIGGIGGMGSSAGLFTVTLNWIFSDGTRADQSSFVWNKVSLGGNF